MFDAAFVSVGRLMLRSSQNLKEQGITVILTHMTRNLYISRLQKNVQKNLPSSNIRRIHHLLRVSALDLRTLHFPRKTAMFRVFRQMTPAVGVMVVAVTDYLLSLQVSFHWRKVLLVSVSSWIFRIVGFVAGDARGWRYQTTNIFRIVCSRCFDCQCVFQPSQVAVPFVLFLSLLCWNAQTKE